MVKIRLFPVIFLIGLIIIACSKYELDRIAFLKVVTVGISELGTNSVTLVGNTENLRDATIEESGFILSLSNTDNSNLRLDQQNIQVIRSDQDIFEEQGVFLANVEDLEPGETYYYRAYLKIKEEVSPAYGEIDSFTTIRLSAMIMSIERSGSGCPTAANITLNIETNRTDNSFLQAGIAWRNDVLTMPTTNDNIISVDQLDGNGMAQIQLPVNCNDFYSIRAFISLSESEVIYSQNREFTAQEGGGWQSIGDFPEPMLLDQNCKIIHSFVSEGKAYVFGWSQGFEEQLYYIFDPTNYSWTSSIYTDQSEYGNFCGHEIVPSTKDHPIYFYRPFIMLEHDVNQNAWTNIGALLSALGSNPFLFEYQEELFTGTGFGINGFNEKAWKVKLPITTELIQIPDYPGGPQFETVFFLIDDKGYVGLGNNGNINSDVFADFYMLNLRNSTWTKVATFPESIVRARGLTANRKGYVIGGYDEFNIPYPGFWEYDPELDEWIRLKDFGRGDGNADIGFSINGIAYAGFGVNMEGEPRQEFWKYVPELE